MTDIDEVWTLRASRRVCLALLFLLSCGWAAGQDARPIRLRVRGVELHYVERGRGEPLILLHGGQGDYRSWGPQVETLSLRYRVISYSRRYHFPNDNPLAASYRSAYTDADDLAAFIRRLRLGRVHLVGTSAGAAAALVLATEHPKMFRSLVLAEPPVHRWAKDDPRGEALYRGFMSDIWEPAAAAFKAGDDERAMRVLVDGFAGAGRFDGLPPGARAAAMQNSRFFKAATESPDPFPDLPKRKVKWLGMPAMLKAEAYCAEMRRKAARSRKSLVRSAPRGKNAPRAGAGCDAC